MECIRWPIPKQPVLEGASMKAGLPRHQVRRLLIYTERIGMQRTFWAK
jgi:hypothetical protein